MTEQFLHTASKKREGDLGFVEHIVGCVNSTEAGHLLDVETARKACEADAEVLHWTQARDVNAMITHWAQMDVGELAVRELARVLLLSHGKSQPPSPQAERTQAGLSPECRSVRRNSGSIACRF